MAAAAALVRLGGDGGATVEVAAVMGTVEVAAATGAVATAPAATWIVEVAGVTGTVATMAAVTEAAAGRQHWRTTLEIRITTRTSPLS